MSEGASPMKHEYVTNGASRDPCCDVCGEEWGDPIHTHNRDRKPEEQASLPTRQADWEAGRDAAATFVDTLDFLIAKRIRYLSYPGPSGATNMPQSEQTWPCTRCGKSHRQLEGCFLGPSGPQDAPMVH